MSDWWASWNYNQFSWNAYNETTPGQPWCTKKGDIYVNPYRFEYYCSNITS